MICKIIPIGYGKHNNLYINAKIGRSLKNPIINLRLVVFFDTSSVYLSHSNLHIDYLELLDFTKVISLLEHQLSKHDWELKVTSNKDFFVRNLDSEKLFKKLTDENKCVVSAS